MTQVIFANTDVGQYGVHAPGMIQTPAGSAQQDTLPWDTQGRSKKEEEGTPSSLTLQCPGRVRKDPFLMDSYCTPSHRYYFPLENWTSERSSNKLDVTTLPTDASRFQIKVYWISQFSNFHRRKATFIFLVFRILGEDIGASFERGSYVWEGIMAAISSSLVEVNSTKEA